MALPSFGYGTPIRVPDWRFPFRFLLPRQTHALMRFSRSGVSAVGISGAMGTGGHSWARVFLGLVYMRVLVFSAAYKEDFRAPRISSGWFSCVFCP